jgi:hypothetical protein
VVSLVQTNRLSQPFCPLEPHTVAAMTSQTTTNDRVNNVVDYVKTNPINTAMVYPAGAVGVTVAKHRGYTNPQAVGIGFLSSTVPLALNNVRKTIYSSCTAQDGYCSRAWTQMRNEISQSMQDGVMKIGTDFMKVYPITSALTILSWIAVTVVAKVVVLHPAGPGLGVAGGAALPGLPIGFGMPAPAA